MRSSSIASLQTPINRRGVSFVEFVGCLVALSGGLVLGSMYLGVDVQTAAVELLDKADIEVPNLLRGDSPEAQATADHCDTPEAASMVKSTDEPAVTSEEVTGEVNPSVSQSEETIEQNEEVAPASEPVVRRELTAEEKIAATRVYWQELNNCLQAESTKRSQGMKTPGEWQLFDYLIHRKRCHQEAVDAIESLDKYGVDARLTSYSDQALTWQKTGVRLFDRATYLLTDAPSGKLTGPFAQSWQSAATQHRMEERLIQNKRAAVASYLEHKLREPAAAQ